MMMTAASGSSTWNGLPPRRHPFNGILLQSTTAAARRLVGRSATSSAARSESHRRAAHLQAQRLVLPADAEVAPLHPRVTMARSRQPRVRTKSTPQAHRHCQRTMPRCHCSARATATGLKTRTASLYRASVRQAAVAALRLATPALPAWPKPRSRARWTDDGWLRLANGTNSRTSRRPHQTCRCTPGPTLARTTFESGHLPLDSSGFATLG